MKPDTLREIEFLRRGRIEGARAAMGSVEGITFPSTPPEFAEELAGLVSEESGPLEDVLRPLEAARGSLSDCKHYGEMYERAGEPWTAEDQAAFLADADLQNDNACLVCLLDSLIEWVMDRQNEAFHLERGEPR